MGAAIKRVWPTTAHLLCVYHINQNLFDHAAQLFPNKRDEMAKDKFIDSFHRLSCQHGDSRDGAAFPQLWADMVNAVHAVTPCPVELEVGVQESDVYHSCDEEMNEEDVDKVGRCKLIVQNPCIILYNVPSHQRME